jgi:tRNA-splicing ligase RtcB
MERTLAQPIADGVWEIPAHGAMRVPARLYATEELMDRACEDNAPEQAMNVATLPGIVGAALAMPDMHWGYGFPIGGVAAFDCDEGIISPGGVGYDINCGVRLMTADLQVDDAAAHIRKLVNGLFDNVPSGVGVGGTVHTDDRELTQALLDGARWAVRKGFGTKADLECIEEQGRLPHANPDAVGKRAMKRGHGQIGTLGAGNHFLEVGCVDEVFDAEAAAAFGLAKGQLTVMIHCGSRGFGHQVCDDALPMMGKAAAKYGISLPDRQLACAPVQSPEGQAYLGAMQAAVNYAFANRQVIAHLVRKTFQKVFGGGRDSDLRTVYEVAHNIAKFETHLVDGVEKRLCVHRKGATRAFGPNHPDVLRMYRPVGQPVLVPGDMGTCSYVLVGTDKAMTDTFGSSCHGAGRAMSRSKALRLAKGRDIAAEMAEDGILLRARSNRTVGEEMSEAYKDVSEVVDACELSGIARKVVRLRPVACMKG